MPPRPVRQPFSPRVVKTTRAFALSLALSVVLAILPLPWSRAGLAFAVAAVVLGVVAMLAMRSGASTGLWALTIVGTLAAGSLSLTYGASVLFYKELAAYQACSADALTITAVDRCSAEFEKAQKERTAELQATVERWLGTKP